MEGGGLSSQERATLFRGHHNANLRAFTCSRDHSAVCSIISNKKTLFFSVRRRSADNTSTSLLQSCRAVANRAEPSRAVRYGMRSHAGPYYTAQGKQSVSPAILRRPAAPPHPGRLFLFSYSAITEARGWVVHEAGWAFQEPELTADDPRHSG